MKLAYTLLFGCFVVLEGCGHVLGSVRHSQLYWRQASSVIDSLAFLGLDSEPCAAGINTILRFWSVNTIVLCMEVKSSVISS